jgi:hypothetical protein
MAVVAVRPSWLSASLELGEEPRRDRLVRAASSHGLAAEHREQLASLIAGPADQPTDRATIHGGQRTSGTGQHAPR